MMLQDRFALSGGGNTHAITVQVDGPTEEAYLFRFGYLIEFRYGE